MAVRKSVSADILRKIKETLVMSEEVVDGVHVWATFELSGREYLLNCKPALYKVIRNRDMSVVYCEKRISLSKNGRYPSWRLTYDVGASYPFMSYVLTMCCLVDGAMDYYLNNSDAVINHKVSFRDNRGIIRPMPTVYADPRYLEFTNIALNNAHGALVSAYGLFGVSISVSDIVKIVDMIKDLPRDKWASIIRDYYSGSSIDPVVDEDLLLKG